MEQGENLLDIVQLLWKRKKIILLTAFITVVGSAGISLLLPVYYKSTTLFLAASPDQSMPDLVFGTGKREAEYYGGQSDINRILTVAGSSELSDLMIQKFKLFNHYKIQENSPKANYKIRQKLKKLFKVSKTDKDAIAIVVEDRDPLIAMEMANFAREMTDSLVRQLIKKGQEKGINNYRNQIEEKENKISSISDSLNRIRTQYGILNISAQSENLSTLAEETQADLTLNRIRLESLKKTGLANKDTLALLEGTVKGQELLVNDLRTKLSLFSEGMPVVTSLSEEYTDLNRILNYEKEGLRRLLTVYQSETPSTILVESAELPDIKSKPRRSLLVIISLAIALFSLSLGIVIFDKLNRGE